MKSHAFAILILFLPATDADAIVRRHDVKAERYLADPGELAAVGQLERRAEAVLIGERWALTAAHVLNPLERPTPQVRFGNRCYRIRRIFIHPDWEGGWPHPHEMHDLAVLELEHPVEGVEPILLYEGSEELGAVVTLVGRGRTGDGMMGQVAEKDHILRRGTNRIDAVTATTLFLNFDAPPDTTPLEAIGGKGDSGGPALLEVDGDLRLAGIGSATTGVPDLTSGLYGTFDLYTRVSGFAGWIHNAIVGGAAGDQWSAPVPCGPGEWPSHSASVLAERFFSAWKEGVVEGFETFYADIEDTQERRTKAERVHRALVERYGPVRIDSCVTFGDREIRVLARTADGTEWFSVGMSHAVGNPDEVERLYLKTESPPDVDSECSD